MAKIKNERKIFLDAFPAKVTRTPDLDLSLFEFVKKHKNSSTVYYKERIIADFKNSDTLDLYFSSSRGEIVREKKKSFQRAGFDSLVRKNFTLEKCPRRVVIERKRGKDYFSAIEENYVDFTRNFADFFRGNIPGVSLVRAWNVSIVSSVIFGMFLMTMIYRYLGQSAQAGTNGSVSQSGSKISWEYDRNEGNVLGDESGKNEENEKYIAGLIDEYQKKIQKGRESESLEKEIREMTKGYPIEKMAPYIARKDKIVAAFLIGIAKKESGWGTRVPIYNGQDTFNYWGYRGIRKKMGTGNHTCFDSPEDAVNTVAKRIEFLVEKEKIDTPKEMVTVWKCGYDCSWDDPSAVRKWVSDVNMYFDEFNKRGAN